VRNDARPIGEDAPASPVGGSESRGEVDAREPAKPIINREDSRRVNRSAQDDERRVNRAAEDDERRVNPAAVNEASTLRTKI